MQATEGRHSVMDTNFLSLLGKEDNCGMKRALLEVIASGVVTRPQDVERYAACTFFASVPSQENANDSDAIIKTTVQFLVQNEFVRLQRCGDADSDGNKENENGIEEVTLSYVTLFLKLLLLILSLRVLSYQSDLLNLFSLISSKPELLTQ